jgi:acetone carboxylase gamma subunit
MDERTSRLIVGGIILAILNSWLLNYCSARTPIDPSLSSEEKFVQSVKNTVRYAYWIVLPDGATVTYMDSKEQQQLSLEQGRRFCEEKKKWQNEIWYKDRVIMTIQGFRNVYERKWEYGKASATLVWAIHDNSFRYLCPELNSSKT